MRHPTSSSPAWVFQGGRTPDWVFSEASNTHLTNDKSWFERDFVAFESCISNPKVSQGGVANIPVYGIGTVVLPVKQSLAGHATSIDKSLRLENVLYVPDYPCNVIGNPIKSVASIQFSSMTPRGAMVYGDGSIAAIFMPGRDFYQVVLREPMIGSYSPSVLEQTPHYGFMVQFNWPSQEQQRWRYAEASLRSPPKIGTAFSRPSLGQPFVPTSMEVDPAPKKSRKRGACDDDFDCSPRMVKRSRAMDEMEFGSPRSPMVYARG